jgi:hypothetical protein
MAMKPKLKQEKVTTDDVGGIRIEIIKENKDGSADAQVHFNKEGLATLVQWGIVSLLTAAIDEYRVRPEEGSKVAIGRARATAKKEIKTYAGGKPNYLKKAPKK